MQTEPGMVTPAGLIAHFKERAMNEIQRTLPVISQERKDALLTGEEIKVLDKGYVKLIDWMGDDARIVEAARTSYSGRGVSKRSNDRTLLRFLFRKRHTTPFEFGQIVVESKLPIFVARQLVRHRTQAINEMSGRYCVIPDEFYVPPPERIRTQSKSNKQGSDDEVMATASYESRQFEIEAGVSFSEYNRRVNDGMAKELARANLPVSTYTKWWSTMNLHNFLHLVSLRDDAHAQDETAAYGAVYANIVEALFPETWEAYCDYRKFALTLTRHDILALQVLMRKGGVILAEHWSTQREAEEFHDKQRAISAPISCCWENSRIVSFMYEE
jgi:thymidylate synthase (FAD)